LTNSFVVVPARNPEAPAAQSHYVVPAISGDALLYRLVAGTESDRYAMYQKPRRSESQQKDASGSAEEGPSPATLEKSGGDRFTGLMTTLRG
jgi:hypothetical protein